MALSTNSTRTWAIRMSLTKQKFGQMLMDKLNTTADIVILSRWAYQVYLDNSRVLEPGLKEVLLELARMEDSPQFEYSDADLFEMARAMAE